MTTPAGSTLYDYDGDGRMTSLTNPYSETSSWTYLNNSWLASQELANGVTTTYTLNAQGMLTDLSTKNSSSTLLSEFSVPTSAGYDGAMNALSVTASVPGYSTYGGTTDYTYDTKNQLLEEASTRNGSFTNYFAYDSGSGSGVGNPSTMRGNTYTFNSDNQITNSGFSYDGEGNPTTYGGTSLTFDVEDRMTAYGSAMSAGYDGFGRRAWKENTGGTTYFLYDGMEPVCELNSSGSLTAVNTFGANGLLSRRVSSTSTFYTFDNQGGAAQRLDSGGGNVDTNQFDAFGNRIASTDSSTDPFSGYGAQWGYYTDSETGLELLGFRYYDPAVGRFINRDPIGYDGGLNLYAYVGNNPVSWVDPSGQMSGLAGAALVGLVVLGGGPEDPIGDILGAAAADAIDGAAADAAADAAGDGAATAAEDGEQAAANSEESTGSGDEEPEENDEEENNPCGRKPGGLRLPPNRDEGADPFKLANQIQDYGMSTEDMPPVDVVEGANGEQMIYNGVTRATRAHMSDPDAPIPTNVVDNMPDWDMSDYPTVAQSAVENGLCEGD